MSEVNLYLEVYISRFKYIFSYQNIYYVDIYICSSAGFVVQLSKELELSQLVEEDESLGKLRFTYCQLFLSI